MGFLSKGIMEATRLTQKGKLREATTIIRQNLRGRLETPSESRSATKSRDEASGDSVIDMLPPSGETGDAWTAPVASETKSRFKETSPNSFKNLKGLSEAGSRAYPAWHGSLINRGPKKTSAQLVNGATFESFSFTNEAGTRDYKLYIPSNYNGSAMPLVMMLHGCTQSSDDFAAGTRMNEIAEEQNLIVAYPAQSNAANSSRCWNWFNQIDQQRGKGEASIIAGITAQVCETLSIDTRRVYVAGLSAGGAMAAILGETYPDVYAAVGVHSGLPCGAASNISSAFTAMKHGASLQPAPRLCPPGTPVPTIVLHGDADTTVNCINGDDIIARAKYGLKLQTKVVRGRSAGGIKYTRTIERDEAGRAILEQWRLHQVGHAWSGGSSKGSFTNPAGPDASREMIRFFREVSESYP